MVVLNRHTRNHKGRIHEVPNPYFCSAALLFSSSGMACTMYKLTKDGKTIVGNNEDWTSPNGQFWFEAGTENTFGAMYMGS